MLKYISNLYLCGRSIRNKTKSNFQASMSIYILAQADQIQGLLKYMNTIRLAAARQPGMGWQSYDEQYRLRQARHGGQWGKINVELWMLYIQSPTTQHRSEPYNSHFTSNKKRLTCDQFNYGNCFRDKCKFNHSCAKCGRGSHPALRCESKQRGYRTIQARQDSNQTSSTAANVSKLSQSGSSTRANTGF